MKLRRGMTLAEMLVSMAILGIVGGMIVAVVFSTSRFVGDEQQRIDVDTSASRVLTVLNDYLQQGRAVLDTATIFSTDYSSSSSVLVLAIPSLQADGSLSPTANDQLAVLVESRKLMLYFDADPSSTRSDLTATLTTNVRDFFVRYDADTPNAASAVTLTIQTDATSNGTTFQRTALAYGILHNFQ